MRKTIVGILILGGVISMQSCGKAIKNAKEETRIQDEATIQNSAKEELRKLMEEGKLARWFEGKEFGNSRAVGSNPELGGPDFLKINKDKTADFKVGDMVERMTWRATQDTLFLKSNLREKSQIFIIGKMVLVDEFGTSWKEK
ncbi:MAG: hypothetical protein IPQ18_14890 [Saprospiraceae bacterium]|jgi:hypothetical protein|nr:hypothetical protein [Saprospiraceae bacterium]MBL0295283.1 hypothetical protein [Saprospiraceae bacterium]